MNDERHEALAVAVLVVAATAVAGIGATGAAVADFGPADAAVQEDANSPALQANALSPALQDDSPPAGGESSLGDADTTFLGTSEDDRAGTAVAGVGDVNGDGVPDVAVGAPNADAGGTDSGVVALFYGPVERGDLDLADADATFVGASARDRAGFDVAGGDVNGDGVSDLIIGAPVHNSSAGTTGAVHVVFGGDAVEGTASLADADATLIGAAPGDEAGYAVGAVANASDGGAAVVVGAPGDDTNGDDAGSAYVVDVVSSGDSSLTDAGTVLLGERAGDRAGFDVAGGGDANDDGAPDVLVGAPAADASGNDSGAAYAVTDALDAGAVGLSEVGIRLAGSDEGDRAGSAISAVGDLNADGVTDLVVGAPRSDANGNDSGAAHVVYGTADLGDRSLADADATLAGASPGDLAGWSVAGSESATQTEAATETGSEAGDATCDGIADVLVGAPAADANRNAAVGAAYLVGDVDGTTNLSDATATFIGEADGDFAGSEVAVATDATGDGAGDLLVGAPRNDANGNESGAAYLLASDCPADGTTQVTTDATTTTTAKTTTTEMRTTTVETTTTTTTTTTTLATTTTATPATTTTASTTTASETPTPTQTPSVEVTQVEVLFECTQVSVAADEYDAVVLTFADGTSRSFEGPFTGQRTFASEDGDDVIRSLEVVVDGVSVPVENPVYDQCAGR